MVWLFGGLLLIIGLFSLFTPFVDTKKFDPKEESVDSNLSGVIDMVNQLYGESGKNIEVKNEKDNYVIIIYDAVTNKIYNVFYMNKETNDIIEKPVSITETTFN